ncbi:hypothetical protein CTAYLR_001243 [Chrysophaeum taylorii]|uniref:ODAD1 central coiled coil region domain-containing protein n=1 Tax=Chrysophaeum taylorii TaxID=2483200 RepID=A0AAD7XLC4_9STRA|nr:hypothetical protein CTAYLR_001243 [Chrysophaeum taylorii]
MQLDALHKAQIVYTKRIEHERTRLHQIDKKVSRMRNTIVEFNKSVGGEFVRRERQIGAQRQSTRLESQLQTVKEKHDKLQHKIKLLAIEINNKRREKMQHQRVHQKIEHKLAKRRQVLSRLNKELQEKDEEREQTGRQCESLKGEILEEMEQFNEKVSTTHNSIVAATGHCGLTAASSMQTIQTYQSPSRRFPHSAGSVLSNSSTSAAAAKAPPSFITEQRGPNNVEVDLQHEVNKAYWVVAKTRMDLTKQIERKEELYNAFEKICSETGVHVDHSADIPNGKHPLEQLVPLLLKSEEENYLIFRTINELNQELEALELEKVQLENDLKAREAANVERLVAEEKIKAELGSRLEHSTATEKTHEDLHKTNETDLMRASDAITALFHKLGCEELPNGEALVSTGLTERNVQQFLGLIEDQIVELLQIDTHMNSTRTADDPTRPITPKFNKDGKRLPALVLPDLQHHSAMDASLSGLDDATDDGPDDGQTAPIDPSKWMQTLKAGDASLAGLTPTGRLSRSRK